MRAIRWAAAAALALAAVLPAAGQTILPGFPRINQSDITGPAVTSGDMLNWEPGTVQSLSCPAAWGLLNEGRIVAGQLDSLRLATGDANVLRTPSAAAQRDVGLLLSGGPGAPEAGARVREALAAGNAPGAGPAAAGVVEAAGGLLAAVERIDPLRPGRNAATRLHRAVAAWDELVDASGDAFLATPPDAFVALAAVLGRLDRAAIAHAARVADPRQVDEFGAACAPPPAAQAPAMLAFEACVLGGGEFRAVQGVYLPATGDSLVVGGDGSRRPLREVYPDTGYAGGRGWFSRDTAIVAFGRRYVRWGMSRVARPGELRPATWFQGVPVFAAPDAGPRPEVVYVPFRRGCEVQPYRRADEARRVRGG
ncbi:MAG TPA: hypothetical protein VFJ16_31045 [Longimicrobium sp.]|nr:hypothetical protein [Longimicrobium sp.]